MVFFSRRKRSCSPSSGIMSGITWVHLSDWHQKGEDFDRRVVRDALIKNLRERANIDPVLQQVDFVVFSGDLAFSGKPEEYEAARQHLLDPVLDAVGLKPNPTQKADRLFIVPGNHDLNRNNYDLLPSALQEPLNDNVQVQKWLTIDKRRKHVMVLYEDYHKFVSDYTGQPTPDYASVVRLNAGGRRIALLGLNSAWMCARNKDRNGKLNDYGYALIGEPQIHDALAQIADAELSIGVLHHPFEWLAQFDRNRVKARLQRACHFILRGHEHCPQVELMRGTAGDCVIIPAGACYERRIAEDPHYTIAYNLVHLDFEAARGVIYLRRWSERQNAWIEDIDSHPGGKYDFSFVEKTSTDVL